LQAEGRRFDPGRLHHFIFDLLREAWKARDSFGPFAGLEPAQVFDIVKRETRDAFRSLRVVWQAKPKPEEAE
jgi:hypothetical protein